MTVGVGYVSSEGWAALAADSRITVDTVKCPGVKKIHQVGSVCMAMAGDLGQHQSLLRQLGSLHSVDELASSMEELHVTGLEMLAIDLRGLWLVRPDEDGAVYTLPVRRGEYALIGSGGQYVHGYLEAHPLPDTPTEALRLCKDAMKACARHYMCVGAPYYGKILWL